MLQEQVDWDKRACLKVERLKIVDEWMFSCSTPTKTPSVVSERWGGGRNLFKQGSYKWKLDTEEGQMSELSASDLLLEGSLCSPGSSISSGRLYSFVRHDARGKFLLCLLKTGTGGTVHPMDLRGEGKVEKRVKLGPEESVTDITQISYRLTVHLPF